MEAIEAATGELERTEEGGEDVNEGTIFDDDDDLDLGFASSEEEEVLGYLDGLQ
jgi:hypothetical protein